MSPNAQLCSLNPHVGASLRSHTTGVLPSQPGALCAGEAMGGGGVSSFGYAGTIAHLVSKCAAPELGVRAGSSCQLHPYKRLSFPWVSQTAESSLGPQRLEKGSVRRDMYTISWPMALPAPPRSTPERADLWLHMQQTAEPNAVTPTRTGHPRRVAVLLTGASAAAPTSSAVQYISALMHKVSIDTSLRSCIK